MAGWAINLILGLHPFVAPVWFALAVVLLLVATSRGVSADVGAAISLLFAAALAPRR
ncbi:MAG TPA: hypothetical protein VNU26_17815 [Mycobacteriales bacterium]|nr:hypothetical protein [Mycobacteriales bacterium]